MLEASVYVCVPLLAVHMVEIPCL